jgi:hypothetical protein
VLWTLLLTPNTARQSGHMGVPSVAKDMEKSRPGDVPGSILEMSRIPLPKSRGGYSESRL